MSENQMKDRLVEELKKAKDAGRITSEKVYDIVKTAVADAVAESKGGVEELRAIVKNVVVAAVEGLKAVEADVSENIEVVVEGAIAGVRSREDQAVDVVRKEIRELETKLETEKTKLAQSLGEGLEGAKEAGATLPEGIRNRIEFVLTDIKLKSTELFGLTKQTVKEAVKRAIESSEDVKETVAQITKDATERALKEGRFRADKVKEIAEKVLSGAVEAAEEIGKEVKNVAHGAFEGVQEGIASAVESIGDKTNEFLHDDLARTKDDLKAIEELFLETVLRVASRSGELAKGILTNLVEQSGKTTSVLREKTGRAAEKVAVRLKVAGKEVGQTIAEAGGKVARVMADEAMELGKRSVDIAKGAISGMWQGAKEAALKKGNDNK